MKHFWLIVIMLCINLSCSNDLLFVTGTTNYIFRDLAYDVNRYVKLYYCDYLKYPTVDELYTYCWRITNSANDFRFQSFTEFEKVEKMKTNGTGVEDLLRFMLKNKTDLAFRQSRGELYVLWKGKKAFRVNYDYCLLKDNYRDQWHFYCFFDSVGVAIPMDANAEDSFINLRKNICQKYYFDQELKRASENILLRYNRDTGYKVFCSTKVDIDKNDYLKELGCSLDTFLLNRNIQMIQFITTAPY